METCRSLVSSGLSFSGKKRFQPLDRRSDAARGDQASAPNFVTSQGGALAAVGTGSFRHMNREEWNRRYADSELVWSAGPNQFLATEVAGWPPGRALDVACGEGRNALWLAEQGWEVTAIDFADAALQKGRALAERRGLSVRFFEADVLEAPYPGGPYDLVILFYVQLPAAERRRVVRAGAEALAPGGALLVVGHDTTNLEHGVGGPQDPEVLFTPDDLLADLAGMDDLLPARAERRTRRVETDAGPSDAIDAFVLVTRAA